MTSGEESHNDELTVAQYFELLAELSTVGKDKSRSLKLCPFEQRLCDLQYKYSKDETRLLHQLVADAEKEQLTTVTDDSNNQPMSHSTRDLYSRVLIGALKGIAAHPLAMYSTQQITVFASAMQVVVAVVVCTALDEGVGVPLDKRVTDYRLYQALTTVNTVNTTVVQLSTLVELFTDLLSIEPLQRVLVEKYAIDLLAVFFQNLHNLRGIGNKCKGLHALCATLKCVDMLKHLLVLQSVNQKRTADWLKVECLKRFCECLANERTSVKSLLMATNVLSLDNEVEVMSECSQQLSSVSVLLVRVPPTHDAYTYHEHISQQVITLHGSNPQLYSRFLISYLCKLPQIHQKCMTGCMKLYLRQLMDVLRTGTAQAITSVSLLCHSLPPDSCPPMFWMCWTKTLPVLYDMYTQVQHSTMTKTKEAIKGILLLCLKHLQRKMEIRESYFELVLDKFLFVSPDSEKSVRFEATVDGGVRCREVSLLVDKDTGDERMVIMRCQAIASLMCARGEQFSLLLHCLQSLSDDTQSPSSSSPSTTNHDTSLVQAESVRTSNQRARMLLCFASVSLEMMGGDGEGEGEGRSDIGGMMQMDMPGKEQIVPITVAFLRRVLSSCECKDRDSEQDQLMDKCLCVLLAILSLVLMQLTAEDQSTLSEMTVIRALLSQVSVQANTLLSSECVSSCEGVHQLITALFGGADSADDPESDESICSMKPSTSKQTGNEVQRKIGVNELIIQLQEEGIPEKGHALIELRRMLRRRDSGDSEGVNEAQLEVVMAAVNECVTHEDSYVYLNAIDTLAVLAYHHHDKQKVIGQLCVQFLDAGGTRSIEERLTIGECLTRLCKGLGVCSTVHAKRLINAYLAQCRAEQEHVRASALSCLADLVVVLKYRLVHDVQELTYCAVQTLRFDASDLCRRAAMNLIRAMIKCSGRDMLNVLGDDLRELYSSVREAYHSDHDPILRLHAQLCLDELKVNMDAQAEQKATCLIREIKIQ